jgi:hypothetical protein
MTLLVIPLLLLGGAFLAEPDLPVIPRHVIAVGLLLVVCTPYVLGTDGPTSCSLRNASQIARNARGDAVRCRFPQFRNET